MVNKQLRHSLGTLISKQSEGLRQVGRILGAKLSQLDHEFIRDIGMMFARSRSLQSIRLEV